jgi:phosphoribosylamine--glycine ligase / phosphoribosylformylglycinamidine cyclo-ligase
MFSTLKDRSWRMNVLLVGSGGREHAIAWKLAQSPRLSRLWIAPGNPGTALIGENIPLAVDDVSGLVQFAHQNAVDLVVIGPEAALAAGLSDALRAAGVAVFGPSQAAAQIETSKSFSKRFMQRHGISTACFAVFHELEPALKHLNEIDYPVVIKASGLAAGKGVILPVNKREAEKAVREMLLDGRFGGAGEEIVIEERLEGEEVSLLAFSDGLTLAVMPPAQDHKRLLDNDLGPNTGGMGAYAPAPACPPALQEQVLKNVLQPTIDGLRNEKMPFVGVLYAGLILTTEGPRVLEFNARFGDPETQVILPLLDSDLLAVFEACTQQKLAEILPQWKNLSAACVVVASGGYPEKSIPPAVITGLDTVLANCQIFHAGTCRKSGQIFTAGGRVLGVTGTAKDLSHAVTTAYALIDHIHFEGMQYRKDIAQKALKPRSAYQHAGVNIDAGNRAVKLMRAEVQSTYNEHVLAGIGSFGGLYDAVDFQTMHQPVMVASTDGVGTKVKLAAALGRYRGVGMDIVNHCIDDILVQGAHPLFFLDYFATSKLQPEIVAEIVGGMAEACRAARCVLLGGETAEMPGVYCDNEFDVAGTIVGCVERNQILPRGDIQPGDRLIGIRSNGSHTNGYSLLRKIFESFDLNAHFPELNGTLADALLMPHRSYLDLLLPILSDPASPIKAMAHITGGGFVENIPRILPDGMGAVIKAGSWPVLPLFHLAQKHGQVDPQEMYRVFNMGIGMVVILRAEDAPAFQSALPEPTWVIGEVVREANHEVKIR